MVPRLGTIDRVLGIACVLWSRCSIQYSHSSDDVDPRKAGELPHQKNEEGDTIPNTHAITLLDHRGTSVPLYESKGSAACISSHKECEAVPLEELRPLPDKDSLSTTNL
jgi:hypothetical protein